MEHDDDITAIAMHPDGNTVATGQIGRNGSGLGLNSFGAQISCGIWTHLLANLFSFAQCASGRRTPGVCFVESPRSESVV